MSQIDFLHPKKDTTCLTSNAVLFLFDNIKVLNIFILKESHFLNHLKCYRKGRKKLVVIYLQKYNN
jgi:hypothetical protein